MLRALEDLHAPGYDLVVISPHLDDAVLSCAGEIAHRTATGGTVLVVTVFSGSQVRAMEVKGPFAAFSDMAARRAEDARAMDQLGCDHLWLGYEEAPSRDRRYASPLRLISAPLAADAPLMSELRRIIGRILDSCSRADILFPLGLGGHVDHRIVFHLSRSLPPGVRARICYYEEVPYAYVPFALESRLWTIGAVVGGGASLPDSTARLRLREVARRATARILDVPAIRSQVTPWQRHLIRLLVTLLALRARTGRRRRSADGALDAMVPRHVDVTPYETARIAAALEYASQMPVLFVDAESFHQDSLEYSARVGGRPGQLLERRWYAAADRSPLATDTIDRRTRSS